MSQNIAASVQQRLMNLYRSQERQEDFQKLLQRYALERLLYRLSYSNYRNNYILKGAMLFSVWMGKPHRSTQDLDLLGIGNNTIAHLKQVFQGICRVPVQDDGLAFLEESIQGNALHTGQKYEGVRLKLMAKLGKAQIPLQVDIGFGQIVTPAPQVVIYPTLLNFPAPSIKAYPPQTVIAEKFQAMVMLEMNNSRMKDFYDLWILGRDFSFEGQTLAQALQATFKRRNTLLPTTPPVALKPEFSEDPAKQYEWQNFLNKNKLDENGKSLSEVTKFLQDFLMPPCLAVAQGKLFNKAWSISRGWEQNEQEQQVDILNLATVILAKRLLESMNKDTYKTEKYYFSRQGETVTINALDGRGEIARIQDGVFTGNLSATDIYQVRELEKNISIKEEQAQQQPNLDEGWELSD